MEAPNAKQHSKAGENDVVDVTELRISVVSSEAGEEARVADAAEGDPDATDYSSSFADTSSRNGNCSSMSDAEVESQFDCLRSIFPIRKQRLTSHWRNFIRPLMWRCKWAELKIKQFESRALKYAEEIAAHDREKKSAVDEFIVERIGSKSVPCTWHSQRRKAMKRRRRKRIEDATDTKTYLSSHVLSSYHENKKSDPDGTSKADNFVLTEQKTTGREGFDVDNDWLFLEEKDNVLEQILRKIDVVLSRVHKLKGHLDSVMSKHAEKFSSSEALSHLVPCDLQASTVCSPTFSTCNGDAKSVGGVNASGQRVAEYDMVDFMLPGSAVSSYGEATHIPDVIESTVVLLSCADIVQHQSLIGDSCEDIVDSILVQNRCAEEGRPAITNSKELTVKHVVQEKSAEEDSTNPALEADTGTKAVPPVLQSSLKLCLAQTLRFNKRKRGERKASADGWSKK